MARFKLGSPLGLLLVLSIGGGISLALMLSSIWLTERQKVYSDAINNAGRLRFMTERFGSLLLLEKLMPQKPIGLPPSAQVFQELNSICNQLVGRDSHAPGEFHAPEIPDASIRSEFSRWQKQAHLLNETGSNMSRRAEAALRFTRDVVEVVDTMDDIVTLLSGKAQEWIQIMLGLHIIRVAWQFFFYVMLTFVFKWIWIPFVKTFNDLRSMQQQQESLLRADFDAVVEIHTTHPFVVRRSCTAFDDLVGKPMLDKSILQAASNESAKAALADFLTAGVVHPSQHLQSASRKARIINYLRSLCCSFHIFAWPTMAADKNSYECPLAPKINSKWNCDVELLLVGKSIQSQAQNSALLAVRQLGEIEREVPDLSHIHPGASPSNDFHTWSKALQVDVEEDRAHLRLASNRPENACARAAQRLSHTQRGARTVTSSSSFSSRQGNHSYKKRRLIDLDSLEVVLGEMSEIETYTFCFDSENFDNIDLSSRSSGKLDFMSCVVGEPGAHFVKWWQESVNTILSCDSVSKLDYDGEVWLRPPTAACASSRVVLCAQSASCAMIEDDSTCGCRWSLQFFDVSQLIKSSVPNQVATQILPAHAEEATLSL